ncbi:porin [Cupriavidus sp. NPDC089707]|uniref:porin n=1 Tax=Cupriavidus sp. NPDC089707 TaxID=3363963 RepID=UPI0037F3C29F
MRKSRIALAAMATLMTMAGMAHGATGVTLYGVIDASVEYVNRASTLPTATTQSVGPLFRQPFAGGLSASRWGLRGTEDLGGGLQAVFVLESGFQVDSGQVQSSTAGMLFSRVATVGLSNANHKVTFGRQATSITDGLVNFSPMRFAATYEPGIWEMGINYRENNMVKYTGTYGPVQTVAHYSFGTGAAAFALGSGTVLANGGNGETPGNWKDNTAWGASLLYLDGRFGFGLAYDQWNPAVTTGSTGKIVKVGAAASYTTGPLKVMGGYRWNRAEFANGNSLIRDGYYWAGVNYQATRALALQLGYFYADIRETRAPTVAGSVGPGSNPTNPYQVSLTLDYALSKRTDVYIATAWAHNGALAFDSVYNAFAFGYAAAPGQKNMVGVTTGIRHVF